ncbi:bifunctional pyr operon transcriptional regulator/uracil phosphoribosyltransferase PyrR [Canibacter sp. lx-72]|nr:bifunctional pyr operon transcriptional regulator/uracil phosphoribosyltransferase PyrR [Canibacter zhuwentaonis]MBT1017783.1 bifunctional pyr operon transcriptional regulator/uracil phosphoribosyltransferase PyrR [Canibacter zhuwentaonis]
MRIVLEATDMRRALTRISHEILEFNKGASDLVIVGVQTRGVSLAERIAAIIGKLENTSVPVIELNITKYRDDLAYERHDPLENSGAQAQSKQLNNKTVVLVDDVLYSGRTVRAALDALREYGRPSVIKLAALIDRGHREVPIRADFIGKNLPSAKSERILVRLAETDGVDEVLIGDISAATELKANCFADVASVATTASSEAAAVVTSLADSESAACAEDAAGITSVAPAKTALKEQVA